MIARSSTVAIVRALVRHLFRVAAITGVAVTFAAPVHAQEAGIATADQKREPVLYTFTVDVAEDLAGKFRPTFVKPEHTPPERGSFFVTEGRVFPAGTIEGDGATSIPTVAATLVCLSAAVRISLQRVKYPRLHGGSRRRSCSCSGGRPRSS